MTVNFDVITDPKIKGLAIDIYENLSITRSITVFELISNDIYCQIGEKESFVFSIEVKGDDADFFLFDFFFIIPNTKDFETFRNNIMTVIKSVLIGDYEIETVKMNKILLSSAIIFPNQFRVQLYNNIFLSFLNRFSSRLTKHVTKGRSIIIGLKQG